MEYTYDEAAAVEIVLTDLKLDLMNIPHEDGKFEANSVYQLLDSYRQRFTELADKRLREMEMEMEI